MHSVHGSGWRLHYNVSQPRTDEGGAGAISNRITSGCHSEDSINMDSGSCIRVTARVVLLHLWWNLWKLLQMSKRKWTYIMSRNPRSISFGFCCLEYEFNPKRLIPDEAVSRKPLALHCVHFNSFYGFVSPPVFGHVEGYVSFAMSHFFFTIAKGLNK